MTMRDGFREIVTGHALIDDFGSVTDIIEASAAWVKANGGIEACTPDERATISFLIERQFALAEKEGFGLWDRV